MPQAVLGSEDTKKRQKSLPSWNLHLECVGQGRRFRETNEDAVVITWARDEWDFRLRPGTGPGGGEKSDSESVLEVEQQDQGQTGVSERERNRG